MDIEAQRVKLCRLEEELGALDAGWGQWKVAEEDRRARREEELRTEHAAAIDDLLRQHEVELGGELGSRGQAGQAGKSSPAKSSPAKSSLEEASRVRRLTAHWEDRWAYGGGGEP